MRFFSDLGESLLSLPSIDDEFCFATLEFTGMFIQGEEDCIDKEEEEALGDRERFSLPVVNTNAEVNEQRHEQRATNGCKLQLRYYRTSIDSFLHQWYE